VNKKIKRTRINHEIRVPKVMIVRDSKKIGVFAISDAIQMAYQAGLDLVEVSPSATPPVCSILDYGKYKYEQKKREKAKKQSVVKEKEITFRYVIDENDLNTKLNQAEKFLQQGYKVKLAVKFKRREHAHKDEGFKLIKKCLERLIDYARIDSSPKLEGDKVSCRLEPKKE